MIEVTFLACLATATVVALTWGLAFVPYIATAVYPESLASLSRWLGLDLARGLTTVVLWALSWGAIYLARELLLLRDRWQGSIAERLCRFNGLLWVRRLTMVMVPLGLLGLLATGGMTQTVLLVGGLVWASALCTTRVQPQLEVPGFSLPEPFPAPAVPVPLPDAGGKLPDDWREERYEWELVRGGSSGSPERFTIEVPIQVVRYEEFRKRPHGVAQESDFARFVLENLTHETSRVASKLRELHEKRRFRPFDEVCNILAFVQQFRYGYDQDTKGVPEYPRYPIETLVDRIGDCDCHAILCAALLKVLGYDVVLLGVSFKNDPVGHLAVGVEGADHLKGEYYRDAKTGKRYFYCEATPSAASDRGLRVQWRFGEFPFSEIARLEPVPLNLVVT